MVEKCLTWKPVINVILLYVGIYSEIHACVKNVGFVFHHSRISTFHNCYLICPYNICFLEKKKKDKKKKKVLS